MKDKKQIGYRNLIDIAIIAIVALIISIPLFYSKLDVYRDDGIQHIARAYGTFSSLKDNFWAPNVISSFANGFGYSWNLFYGPLSTYAIILFKLIVKNYIVAYKVLVYFCMFLSGFFMYKFVKTLTKINDIGLLAGILYMTFPYHLTDLYIRNALGEYMSFIFIPIVFLGVYNVVFNDKENPYYLAIGASGLILTHNLSTIIVAAFAILYTITKLENFSEKRVRHYLIVNIVFILLVTSFYWLPLLETHIKANYQVYQEGMMATPESVADHGLKLKQLFITLNDGSFVFELGLNTLAMFVFSIAALKIIDKPLKEHYIFFLIASILCMWMSTKYFPWKILPKEFAFIQFPWRMMMMTAFFVSIVCAINMYLVIIRFNIKDVIVITLISLFCTLFFLLNIFLIGNPDIENIENINLGNFSGREYEVVLGAGKGEYLPKEVYADKFNLLATKEDKMIVTKGKAVIENEKKEGSHYTANVKTFDSEYTIFELPFVYYPGYQVRCDGIVVNNFPTENGFVGFIMGAKDKAFVEVKYTGTRIMKTSTIVSIISVLVFMIAYIKACKDLKKQEKDYIIEKIENDKMEEKNV